MAKLSLPENRFIAKKSHSRLARTRAECMGYQDTHHRFPVHSSWFRSKARNNNFGDVFLAPLYIAAICRSIRLMWFSSFHSFRLFSCVFIRWPVVKINILSLPRYLHVVMRHASICMLDSSTARQRRAGQYHKVAGGSDWEALKRMLRMPCRVEADSRSDNLTQAISESELQ